MSYAGVSDWYSEFSEGRKEVSTQPSAARIMAGVFWDSEGVIYVDFLPLCVTINARYYSNWQCAQQVIWKK
jgi:hypothetical protein